MGIPQIRYSFKIIVTYTELCNHDVHQTAHHYKRIKGVPGIYKIVLYNPKQREKARKERKMHKRKGTKTYRRVIKPLKQK